MVLLCDVNGLSRVTITHTHTLTKLLAYTHTLAHNPLFCSRLRLVVKQSRPS